MAAMADPEQKKSKKAERSARDYEAEFNAARHIDVGILFVRLRELVKG